MLPSLKPQGIVTVRNKTNEGEHSREDKRTMAREEDAWAFPMKFR